MPHGKNPLGSSIFLGERREEDDPPQTPRRSRGTPPGLELEEPACQAWGSHQIPLIKLPSISKNNFDGPNHNR